MDKKIKTAFSVIVIIISLIVIGFVIKFYVDDRINENKLRSEGEVVKGIVIEKTNYRKFKTYITCKYIYKGRVFHVKEKVNKFESINDVEIEVGDSLDIFVESKKPKNSIVVLESFIYDGKKE